MPTLISLILSAALNGIVVSLIFVTQSDVVLPKSSPKAPSLKERAEQKKREKKKAFQGQFGEKKPMEEKKKEASGSVSRLLERAIRVQSAQLKIPLQLELKEQPDANKGKLEGIVQEDKAWFEVDPYAKDVGGLSFEGRFGGFLLDFCTRQAFSVSKKWSSGPDNETEETYAVTHNLIFEVEPSSSLCP